MTVHHSWDTPTEELSPQVRTMPSLRTTKHQTGRLPLQPPSGLVIKNEGLEPPAWDPNQLGTNLPQLLTSRDIGRAF